MVSLRKIDPEGIEFPSNRHAKGRADANVARTRRHLEAPFVAIDGEAVNHGNDYCLLSCGSESLYHPDSSVLTLDEVFEFLYSQYERNPDAIYVGFFLGYDFAKWLQHLPEERARMLLTDEGKAKRKRKIAHTVPFPVRWGRWEFDILALKRLKLRRYIPRRKKAKKDTDAGWMYICDAGPFFQTSFLKAIDPSGWPEGQTICSPEEYETIRQGKDARQDTTVVDDAMIRYNVLENELMSRLMTELRKGLQAAGISLRKQQWFGPGQVASAWLEQYKDAIPTREDREHYILDFVHTAAQAAYYGGWFEVFQQGNIPGTVYEYDINSAYPSVIETLPCLLHGYWLAGKGKPPEDNPTLRMLEVRITAADKVVGAMPYRGNGLGIMRPLTVQGTYWEQEVRASQKALRAGVVYLSWVAFYRECNCPPPLAGIRELYEKRLEVGKNTPLGKALKLIYNSLYGKFAESVGDDPRWANPVYAGLITAGTRVRILDAIASHPTRTKDLVMVATDGVYFARQHTGIAHDPAEGLGNWSVKEKQDMTVVMPGIYWDEKHRKDRTGDIGIRGVKSRGVTARVLARYTAQLEEEFRTQTRLSDWPAILDMEVPFTILTPKLALAQGKWQQAGLCKPGSRDINSDPVNKRDRWSAYKDKRGVIHTLPYDGEQNPPSRPYDRSFGRSLMLGKSGASLDSDDRQEAMLTIDGPDTMLITEEISPE